MNDLLMQSTLRELRLFARAPRFWATFAAIVLIFAFTGPFGTSVTMGPAERFAYWLVVHAVAWALAITLAIVAEITLRDRIAGMFWRMMLGSVCAALPIGVALWAIDAVFANAPGQGVLHRVLMALPLCVLFCVLTYMAMRHEIAEASQPPDAPRSPPLLQRLKPRNRGTLLRLSVQDHYTEIVTDRGRELILLRFSDALNETAPAPGLRTHRSHWVAVDDVESLSREGGRLFIVTKDGSRLPVSRTHAGEVRRLFG